jgi:hypothetical protein
MNRLIATAFVFGMTVTGAHAMPLDACPRGWYPGPFGRCRANGT